VTGRLPHINKPNKDIENGIKIKFGERDIRNEPEQILDKNENI
jgi:hypothetical protein